MRIPMASPDDVLHADGQRGLEIRRGRAVHIAAEGQIRGHVDRHARPHVRDVEDPTRAGVLGGEAVRDALDNLGDLGVQAADPLRREEGRQAGTADAVLLGMRRAEGGLGDAETVLELAGLVHGLGRGAGAVHLVPELGVVDVHLVGVDPDDGAILLVHLVYLPGELAAAILRKEIVPDLIPVRQGRQSGAGEFGKGAEVQAVDAQADAVQYIAQDRGANELGDGEIRGHAYMVQQGAHGGKDLG